MGDGWTLNNCDTLLIQVNQLGVEVSSVAHKCVIEVDEKGTEAAAVTEIDLEDETCACGMPPKKKIRMRVDRAFFFMIVASGGTPLFSGICADP